MWGDLCAELGFGFARVGALTVALAEDRPAGARRLLHHAAAKGVPGVERWNRDQVLRAEPNLTPDLRRGRARADDRGDQPLRGLLRPGRERCRPRCRDPHRLRGDRPLRLRRRLWTVTTTSGRMRSRSCSTPPGCTRAPSSAWPVLDGYRIVSRKGEEYLLDKRLRGLVTRVIYPCPIADHQGHPRHPHLRRHDHDRPDRRRGRRPDDATTTADGARTGARRGDDGWCRASANAT